MSDTTASTGTASPGATGAQDNSAAPVAPGTAKAPENASASPAGASQAKPETPAAKTFKVKVDGQEQEISEEELLKAYSKAAGADKRLKEAAEARKAADSEKAKLDSLVKAAKSGDYAALRDAGMTEDEIEALSINFLSAKQRAALEAERVKDLSPEQREYEELKAWKAEQEKLAKETQEKQQAASVDQVTQSFSNHIISTLELFPEEYRRSDALAQNVVDAWAAVYENADEWAKNGVDVSKITPQKVAETVREDMISLYRSMISKADEKELDRYVPPEIRERFLKTTPAAKAEIPHPSLTTQPQVREKAEPPSNEPKKRMTMAQALRKLHGAG